MMLMPSLAEISGVFVFDTRIDLLDLVKMTGGATLRGLMLTPSLADIVAVCQKMTGGSQIDF